jgi:predicted ABC-type ATPase
MVMIHLESPALNQARISERVSEEGHDVLADKVVSPIPRMLHHVRTSLSLCDVVRVYDNSSADHPFTPIFTVRHGRIERHFDPLPDWAEALLAGF